MVGGLLCTSACGRRLEGAIPRPVDGLADHREEAPNDGVFRQPGVGPRVEGRLAKAVDEQDQRRGGTGALQVGERIAVLLPMKSGAGDDDVGCETGRLDRGGISLRRTPDHPKAGMTVQDVLDQALERRGLYGDQDAPVPYAADPAYAPEPLIRCHDSNIREGPPAFD
jgi:hypothetical protein